MEIFGIKRKAKAINKKAQILDILYFGLILVMLSVLGLIMLKVITDTSDAMAEGDTIDPEYRAYTDNYKERLPSMLEQLFLVVLVGVSVVTLVASFLVRSHPVFYGLMIIVLAFMAWINAIYSNIWTDLSSDSALAALAVNMPIQNHLLSNFPLVMVALSITIVVVMVSKGD